jgi:hypothetical protein
VSHASDWQVYDGTGKRPRGGLSAGLSPCGWRGTHTYPIDWIQSVWRAISGSHSEGTQRIEEAKARPIPLLTGLKDLLDQEDNQLSAQAAAAPLAALAPRRARRTVSHPRRSQRRLSTTTR